MDNNTLLLVVLFYLLGVVGLIFTYRILVEACHMRRRNHELGQFYATLAKSHRSPIPGVKLLTLPGLSCAAENSNRVSACVRKPLTMSRCVNVKPHRRCLGKTNPYDRRRML